MTYNNTIFETPFSDVYVSKENAQNEYKPDLQTQNFESPFQQTYTPVSNQISRSPLAESYMELLAELENYDFKENLYDIADEMSETWQSKVSNELGMGNQFHNFAQTQAESYINPIVNESNRILDYAINHFSGNDFAAHNEASIDMFFETLEINNDGLSPVQEQFLGGLIKKAKSIVKSGVNLAKKGIAAVGKILPINLILSRLKALVKPLLDKVLKSLIGKLPANLQPHAHSLAKKFLNMESCSHETHEMTDLESLEMEFDNSVAQLLFTPEEHEADFLVSQYETSLENLERLEGYEAYEDRQSIESARDKFINELKNLRYDEDPTPAIERFLPVALMALQPVIKMGIGIIGRDKIINFLAGFLSGLIRKYVPEEISKPLATKIIDLGLGVIGFETLDMNSANLGYEAIANTIEETVADINELSVDQIKNEEEFKMHLLESFENAAIRNFPPQYIKPSLKKVGANATWVLMPRNGNKKTFKKFTKVFDITLDTKNTTIVKTFRGLPLSNFIKDKYGLDVSNGVKAKVHVYELKNKGRLSDISRNENLPGFNKNIVKAYIQLHPLTVEAANTLLNEPNLGTNFKNNKIVSRYKSRGGQRFYYIEIENAKLKIPQVDKTIKTKSPSPSTTESRSSDIQAVLNFANSSLKLNYFFSEEEAKDMVEKGQKGDYLSIGTNLKKSIQTVFEDILKNHVSSKVKIIHEALPDLYLEGEEMHDHFSFKDVGKLVGDTAIKKIVESLTNLMSSKAYDSLMQFLKSRTAEFAKAQAEPQDGVTITLVWKDIVGLSMIKSVISAIKGEGKFPDLKDLTLPKLNAPELIIKASKNFD